jgi:SAM-dependent methyltransferase
VIIDLSRETVPTKASIYDRIHFGVIRIVHEGLYGFFVNPYPLLTQAGLKRGQQVLEVGCGPGFFTAPAAKIVGETGHVCALDINPAAVEHVREKIKRSGLANVEAKLVDASETGLPKESIDLAFLFGVMYSFKDVIKVLREMHRVLKTKGTLSIQSGMPADELREIVSGERLFHFIDRTRRISIFEKLDANNQ